MATYDRKLSIAMVLSFMFSLSLIHHIVAREIEKGVLLENRNALNKFYKEIKRNKTKFTWEENGHVCSWKGVTCDENRSYVKFLQLPAMSIIGQIPNNTIGKLKSLERLSLHGNKFTGPIPSDFSNLHALQQFNLGNNSFSGQLPDLDVKNIHAHKFDVSINNLSGCIPKSISMFMFDESSFSRNEHLCGCPLPRRCKDNVCIRTPKPVASTDKKVVGIGVGIAVGSPLLLLVLVACLRKGRTDP